MPVNDRYPLAEVLAACDRYRAKRRRKVFVEYVMLDGVNDLPEHARELAALLDPRVYKVNLIPYNPTGDLRRLLAGADRALPRDPRRAPPHRHRPPHPRPRHRRRLRPARRRRPPADRDKLARVAASYDRRRWPTVDTSVPVAKPPQMSANPVRRVADDLYEEWRERGKFPPGPNDFSLARTHQIAHDPLPLLLGAYEEHGPIFSMRLLHSRVVFMLGPEANHFVTVGHPENFHWRESSFGDLIPLLGDGLLTSTTTTTTAPGRS